MTLWRYAVLLCFCHSKKRVHLFIYLLIYVIKDSLFDWYCYVVVSHNQHKVWIKAFQIFLKKFYYEGKLFRKNNEIQMNRMVSTTLEKPKSFTARSLQEKWTKYVTGF